MIETMPEPKVRYRPVSHAKPVRWSRYHWPTVKAPFKCDQCVALQVEDRAAPVARLARFRRAAEGEALYLCLEHANDQRDADHFPRFKIKA